MNEREKKNKADVEKLKRKIEGDLKLTQVEQNFSRRIPSVAAYSSAAVPITKSSTRFLVTPTDRKAKWPLRLPSRKRVATTTWEC